MNQAEMVALYIKLRDEKKRRDEAHKASLERIVQGMAKLEGLLLAALQEAGVNSFAGAAGTVYRRTETSATIEDKGKFLDWVLEQEDWTAPLDLKANKTFVKQLIEDKQALPPGLKVTQVEVVGVQRS